MQSLLASVRRREKGGWRGRRRTEKGETMEERKRSRGQNEQREKAAALWGKEKKVTRMSE